MKFQSIFLISLLAIIPFFSNSQVRVPDCENPLLLDWVKDAMNTACTDKIYAFTYNEENYIYVERTVACNAVDLANVLYNCNTDKFCFIFGRPLVNEQCGTILQQSIQPFLTSQNVIYPEEIIHPQEGCKPLLQLEAEKGDVYIDDACYGVILTAPNGSCFRLKVKNDGTFNSESVRCPN